MIPIVHPTLCVVLALLVTVIASPPSNLPPAPQGVFTVQGSSIIDADIDTTWALLLDFPSYPNWNPFVRSSVITNDLGIPSSDQTPRLNATLRLTVQIPHLFPPVDADTPSNPFHEHTTIDEITNIDVGNYRIAWGVKGVSKDILDAVRWTAVSRFVDEEDGRTKTFYESREVYNGGLAGTIKALFEDALNEAFQAQADAMKARLE